METVFVYGTLRRGQPNHFMMQRPDIQFYKTDSIKAERCTVVATYPGIREGNDTVEGELYHVSLGARVDLDAFEGCPDLYERREVLTNSGEKAWAYYPQPDNITD